MNLRLAIAFAALSLAPQAHAQVKGFSDEWAAIAFSPSTGRVGMGWKSSFKGLVEQAALKHCAAKDAEIVANVSPGWAVLVISEDNKFAAVTAHNGSWKPLVEQAKRDLRKYTVKRAVRAIVVCSGDFKPLDFDIAVPPPALYAVGQEVSAWWNGKYYDASITAVAEGQYKITYSGFGKEWDEWVGADRLKAKGAAKAPAFKAGQEVKAEWKGAWYEAKILAAEDGKFKIAYNGYGSEWDEWVGADRLAAK